MKGNNVLKLRAFFLIFITPFIFLTSASASDISRQAFEASIFGISEISHFGLEEQRFSHLSMEQRKSIVLAKETLLSFFKSIQNKDGKPQQYLSNEINKKFPTKLSIAQSLVDDETSLLAIMIGDFSISEDDKNITFHFSVISSSEGMINATEMIATVKNSMPGWKVSSYKGVKD